MAQAAACSEPWAWHLQTRANWLGVHFFPKAWHSVARVVQQRWSWGRLFVLVDASIITGCCDGWCDGFSVDVVAIVNVESAGEASGGRRVGAVKAVFALPQLLKIALARGRRSRFCLAMNDFPLGVSGAPWRLGIVHNCLLRTTTLSVCAGNGGVWEAFTTWLNTLACAWSLLQMVSGSAERRGTGANRSQARTTTRCGVALARGASSAFVSRTATLSMDLACCAPGSRSLLHRCRDGWCDGFRDLCC